MEDRRLIVLVHSPFLGPSAWEWVARELERRGRPAVVPALRAVADEPYRPWRQIWEAVDDARTVVLVGHSGAGSLLPAIAGAAPGRVAAMTFVDSFVPPPSGTTRLVPAEFVADLVARAGGGDLVPPWSTWFGEAVLRDLVPDADRRARIEHDMPSLPLSLVHAELPVPEGWDRRPCGYLLLSAEPYAPSAAEARARGWPMVEVHGGKHLDMVRAPAAVTSALLDLERAMSDLTAPRPR